MRLLYYYWGEVTANSAQKAMEAIGVQLKVISPQRIVYDNDAEFMNLIKKELVGENGQFIYDAIFSFNYFPDLSRVAEACGVKYIAWVYDSPHNTLESITLDNKCNRVFIFDYALYLRFKDEGIRTVYYQPLPVRNVCSSGINESSYLVNDNSGKKQILQYEHEITFLGNLYDGDQDFYGKIAYMPDYISGYLEAIINAQMQIYGIDLFDSLISSDMMNNISKYVKTDLGLSYRKCGEEIFKNILRRRVTRNERIEVLKRLGREIGNVDLYCENNHPELPVKYCGYAQYETEMPEIFRDSKININITLRSIQTGIPLRVMDILGAGGFCLTNYQAELNEYFENGVDLVWYESIDDLVDKCRYYLSHDKEREAIACNGHKKAMELFSYENQLQAIMAKAFDVNG